MIIGYVAGTPKISCLTDAYPYDKICRFFVVKKTDEQYIADIHPIICFGELASDVINTIKSDDFVKIGGLSKDFNYRDYNLTSHRTKVFVADSVVKINKGVEVKYSLYEKAYDELIKNNINVIDLLEFDRLERKINMKR